MRLPAYKFFKKWLDANNGEGQIFTTNKLPEGEAFNLDLSCKEGPVPELRSLRESLTRGNPYVRNPELSRYGVSKFRTR